MKNSQNQENSTTQKALPTSKDGTVKAVRFTDRRKITSKFTEKSQTQQQFKDEANINSIMARYENTGELPNTNKRTPQYGDFSYTDDYQTSLNRIKAAEESFHSLPAALRQTFNNDPARFYEFVQNPANEKELILMGLLETKEQIKSDPPPKKESSSETSSKKEAPKGEEQSAKKSD